MNTTTTNSLFSTDVVVSIENMTLGKIILVCLIIFLLYFLTAKMFAS